MEHAEYMAELFRSIPGLIGFLMVVIGCLGALVSGQRGAVGATYFFLFIAFIGGVSFVFKGLASA